MSSDHIDSQNPSSSAAHDPSEISSSSSSNSSSIDLSAHSPQRSADKTIQSAKALKALADQSKLT